MDQALLQQRLREARAGQSTTCASLPPELLASIVEHAFPYNHRLIYNGSWLGGLLRFGCTNSSFLESLKYVGRLEIDFMDQRWGTNGFEENEYVLPARYDADVKRWCDIASRRLRHVVVVHVGRGSNTFNPVQTKSIVDCAASFPTLKDFEIKPGEAVATCMSVAANVRAGRFRNLRRLKLDCGQGDLSILKTKNPATFKARRTAKFAYEDLISQLPPDRGMDVLVLGQYQWLMEIGDEDGWDQWSSTFFDLVSKGADVHSRAIIGEIAHFLETPYDGYRSPQRMDTFYSTVERLLTVHGVDINAPYEFTPHWIRPPLWLILDGFAGVREELLLFDEDGDPDAFEPLFRSFMRVLDLVVQHGARSSFDDLNLNDMIHVNDELSNWILARPDCTQRIREAINRGDLCY